MRNYYDVIIIGAGPGGLSAGAAAVRNGARHVGILERDDIPGGILNQCVHDGFGIVRYGAQLSGPEYAEIEKTQALDAGVEILTGHMVTEIEPRQGDRAADEGAFCVTAISRSGRHRIRAGAVVLATGCRERTRGMLSIPGTRPAGIYTAGVAQNLINRKNVMVGRRVVLLGSGDIGLIMARRLTLEGAEVICACEVMEQPSGLARNVRQCLFDFGIPLYLSTTVSDIYGKGRLEGVELSQVDESLRPIPGTERRVSCDTLILSVGLIPENEVAKTAGVVLDPKTNGVLTDETLQSSVRGIFACGNARSVMDLADFVSEQGEVAGANAAAFAAKQTEQIMRKWAQNRHNAALKGMPEEGSVTCTLCPKGCQIRAAVRNAGTEEEELVITGNGCPRGEAFARQEMTDPQRILTTTVRIAGTQELLPVRSSRPVPLTEMKVLSRQLRSARVSAEEAKEVRRGDVLVRDLGSNHADIIAERSAR